MTRFAVPLVVAAIACGRGNVSNSTIKVGQYTMTPHSALAWQSADGGTVVVVSDQSDICGAFLSNRCAIDNVEPAGMLLVLGVGGAAGTYGVSAASRIPYQSDALEYGAPQLAAPPAGQGMVVFESNACTPPCIPGVTSISPAAFMATAGALDMHGKPGGGFQGSYSAHFQTGDDVRGTFSADPCPGLESVSDFTTLCSRTVDASGNVGETCSCEGRTSREDCTLRPCGEFTCSDCTCAPAVSPAATCTIVLVEPCCPMGVKADGGTL